MCLLLAAFKLNCAVPSVVLFNAAVETRQHPLLPVLGNKGAGLPYVANEIALLRGVATLCVCSSRVGGYIDTCRCLAVFSCVCVPLLLLCPGCRWVSMV